MKYNLREWLYRSNAIEQNKSLVASLREQLAIQEQKNAELEAKIATGTACVESLMKKDISWFNIDALPYEQQVAYYLEGQRALENETLSNERKKLLADWIEHAVKGTKSYEELYGMRMCINALEVIWERLEAIPDPRKKYTTDDIYAAV